MRALRAGLSAGLSAEARVRAAGAIAEHCPAYLTQMGAPGGAIVSGFASLPEELNVWPLLLRLRAEGFALALPVVQAKAQPLVFRAWVPGEAMDQGVWDIPQPKAGKPEV